MLRSYIRVALRTFRKNKLTTFINIFGLGLSMSVGMMIMIRLLDQLSYDNFHPYAERTYRVLTAYHKKTGEQWKMASTPLPLLEKLERDFSRVEKSVNVYPAFNGKAVIAGKEMYVNGAYTEPSFFKVFGFSLAAGDPATALKDPFSLVISKATAAKFFAGDDPVGKVLTLDNGESFIVKGVLNEATSKSHLSYDAYASYSSIPQMEKKQLLPVRQSNWYAMDACYTYVMLKRGYPASAFLSDLNVVARQVNKSNNEGSMSFETQRIDKITPGGQQLFNETGNGTSWTKLYFETGVALIILLAACFNYTNLSIARSLTRAKEVGIRKVSGARRGHVFAQYIIESVLVAAFSLIFASILLSFVIRYAPFNDDYEFIPSSFEPGLTFYLSVGCFTLFTGLLAGIAPAWMLSSFKPLNVLKNVSTLKIVGKISVQKALIVFQYSLSLTIIIFLLAFYRQFSFLSAADPGFKRDHVLVVPLNGLDSKLVGNEVAAIPGVTGVSKMSSSVAKHFNGMSAAAWLVNKADAIDVNYYYANASFISNMNLHLVAGSNFPSSGTNEGEKYILLNQQAVTAFGIADAQKAIGQTVWLNDSTRLEIAGVLNDFSYESAGKPIRPLAIRLKDGAYNYLYVSTLNADEKNLVTRIAQLLKKYAPSQSFEPAWLNDVLEKNNSQRATISLLGYLAFMAISIASLGLLGLVIFSVKTKRKEISIRKVIGASERQLVALLSKGFIRLLAIAGFIAIPIGYSAAYLFLLNFAHRVSFRPGAAFLCFLLLLLIGLATIISQTWRAAAANPVKDLHIE